MLQVTEAAARQIKDILREENKEDAHIRVYVSGIGWSGPQLALTLEESVEQTRDQQEEIAGLSIVYEKRIAPFIEGKVIDYHTEPQNGFTIMGKGPGGDCGGCSGC